jgi:hypothetical protein
MSSFLPRTTAGGAPPQRFADDKVQLALAEQLAQKAKGGLVSEKMLLQHALANPTDADVVKHILNKLKAGGGPRAGVVAARGAALDRTGGTLTAGQRTEVARVMTILRREIVGNEHVMEQVERLVEHLVRNKGKPLMGRNPMSIGLAGPPGVGKTELFRALALAFHGDPEAFIYVECNKILKTEDLYAVVGGPVGHVGYNETDVTSPFGAKHGKRAKWEGKEPLLVLFDEGDKIGSGQPAPEKKLITEAFAAAMTRVLDEGLGSLSNGTKIDVRGGLIGISANSGIDELGEKEGAAADEHFVTAFKKGVPPHFLDRISTVMPYRAHSPETRSGVARKALNARARNVAEEVRTTSGKDVNLGVSAELVQFLGECGHIKGEGARKMLKWMSTLVEPHFGGLAERALPRERWQLGLRAMDGQERSSWIERFRAAGGAIPSGVNPDNFPVEFECTNPLRAFSDYTGPLPYDPEETEVAGCGMIGGTGFAVARDGAGARMHILDVAGITPAEDVWREIALPPALQKANADLKVANLDDDHLLFYAVHTAKDGEEPELSCFVYDATAGRGGPKRRAEDPWQKVDAPELALVGGSMAGDGGKAILWGAGSSTRTAPTGR